MSDDADDREFRPRDVREATGMSSRQLNDWDTRGALPSDRASDEGWRRFSAREMFAIAVCARLKADFGVPVERLRHVQDWILEPGPDPFNFALHRMASFGVGVWLCTDFEKTFMVDSELEFADLWSHGYFRAESPRSFVFLNLWPIVNAILGLRDRHLEPHGAGYKIAGRARESLTVRNRAELEVLAKIRSGDYQRVEITSRDGTVETIKSTREYDADDVDLDGLLDEEPFQQVTVTKRGGKPRRVTQTVTKKPPRARRA